MEKLAETKPNVDVVKTHGDVPFANPDKLVLPKAPEVNSLEKPLTVERFATAAQLVKEAKDAQLPSEERFVGRPGESFCLVDTQTRFGPSVSKKLEALGLKGIEYKDGSPDFSSVAVESVTIPNMSSDRYGPQGNFKQVYEATANKWNAEMREGRQDWKPSDIKEWKQANHLDIHECLDGKTCQFVDHEIHLHFSHLGGVGLAKILERLESGDVISSQSAGGAYNEQFDA